MRPSTMAFISPPNVYISNTCLVPGITGGYNAPWCQRVLYKSVLCPLAENLGFLMNYCINFHKKKLKAEKNELDSDLYVRICGYHFCMYIWLIILFSTEKVKNSHLK